MLEPIRNQPINFISIPEADYCGEDCGDRLQQCKLINRTEDWLSFQFNNTSTNNKLQLTGLCDTGTLIYSNTFTASSYTEMNTFNMTWNASTEKYDKLAGGNSAIYVNTNYFTSGRMYRVRVKISDITTAGDQFIFEKVGGAAVSDYFPSVDGWVEVVLISDGSNIRLLVSGTGAESIDDFEIYELDTYLSAIEEGWFPSESDTPESCGIKWCFDNDSDATLTSAFNVLYGKRYRINFRITNMTSGALTLTIGSYTETFTKNGYFTRWLDITSSGAITLIGAGNSSFCFEVLSFVEMTKQHAFALFDLNDNWITDLTHFSGYLRDKYDFYADFSNIKLPNNDPVPDGCYKICAYDGTGFFDEAGDLLQGTLDFNTDTGITCTGDVSVVSNVGRLYIKGGGTMEVNIDQFLTEGNCYLLEIVFRNYPATFGAPDQLRMYYGGEQLFSNPSINGNIGTFLIPFVASAPTPFSLQSDVGVGNDFEIESIRIYIDPSCEIPLDPSFCSDCIALQTSTPCTRKIHSYMDTYQDEIGLTLIKSAFGFQFDNVFRPMMRVKAEFHSFTFPATFEDHIGNDGTTDQESSQLSKEWKFAVASLSESDQNALRMMIRCDNIDIYSTDGTTYETYFCTSKEITAQWAKKEKPMTADVEIELKRRFKDELFNRNSIHYPQ